MKRQLITLVAASALVLTGCDGNGNQTDSQALPEPTMSSSSTGTEDSTDDSEATDDTAEESSERERDQEQISVNPDQFQTAENTWLVSTHDNGQCLIKTTEGDELFSCNLPFADPKPPALSAVTGIDPLAEEPNIASIDPVVGVYADWAPGSQGHGASTYLEPGESTEIEGIELAHLPDGTFKVSMGVHWFTMNDGQFEKSQAPFVEDDSEFVSGEAQAGEVCGEVKSKGDGSTLRVVEEEATDCTVAMEVMSDYMSDSPSGTPPQGSGGHWLAPNSWHCGRSYLFPREEAVGYKYSPGCDSFRATDGSYGSVMAVPTDWEYANL